MPRYAAAARLDRLRTLLSTRPTSLSSISETLEISESTARRMLAALEDAGDALSEETRDDQRKVWSLPRDARAPRKHAVNLSTAQLVSLLIARNSAREILRGTGFDDDLEDACAAMLVTLGEKDTALVRDLDRKFYDRGEMAVDYEAKAEILDEITTAVLRTDRLEIRRVASDGKERTHLFDPYSLVTCKKAFYLVGYSHDRAQRISLGVDAIVDATWQKGNVFPYPDDYDPAKMFDGAIGMFVGPATDVVLRVHKAAARYVLRRPINASQAVTRTYDDGSFDVKLTVAGTTELESLVLSYGPLMQVVSPPALRAKIKGEIDKALAKYADA